MDYYTRLMLIVGGLRHLRETGKVPDNRDAIDDACREVLKLAPSSGVVREWHEAAKRRRRKLPPSTRAT
ncbi:hypothetical protein [Croceibacterium mercuriale]|uniref:hypothetical protein n=1 Tax=Croceibacterium mercuriale TaxID=1572751 RepID=UPI001269F13D|nr:hypothetical protein [Croceibacterium mercuriale]